MLLPRQRASSDKEIDTMTTHQMIIAELAAVGLQIGDLTKPGQFHTLSNGRRIWTQALPPVWDDDMLADPFGANQSSLLMTVLCPECCGETHTIFTSHGDYRKCSGNAAHARVRV
jgi:hypothetical protein